MIVQIVRFKSELPDEEVWRVAEERLPRFREQPGLIQKYYLTYSGTGEIGAVYVWESQEKLDAFRASELFRTIPEAYKIKGAPDVTLAEVPMTLR